MKEKNVITGPTPPRRPWDEKIPGLHKSRFNKWMRRVLVIWAITNRRWDIVILIMLIDDGQEKAVKLDEKMKNESGWQEYLLGRTV